MKYGSSAQIPYGSSPYDVTGVEYCEWEDRLETAKVKADSPEGQWITFDFLISLGHLVSKPKVPRPSKKSPKPKKKVHPNAPATAKGDSWDLRNGDAKEPVWTQSKILSERERLIRTEERLLKKQSAALRQKIVNEVMHDMASVRQPVQLYHEDGTPYNSGNYVSVIFVMFILIVVMFCCVSIKC